MQLCLPDYLLLPEVEVLDLTVREAEGDHVCDLLVVADGRDCDILTIDEQRYRLHILNVEALELILAYVDDIDITLLHNRYQEIDGTAVFCNCGNRTDIVWLPDLDIASLVRSDG